MIDNCRRWLLVVVCWLLVGCGIMIAMCCLFVVGCLWLAVYTCGALPVGCNCSLFVVCSLLFGVCCCVFIYTVCVQ